MATMKEEKLATECLDKFNQMQSQLKSAALYVQQEISKLTNFLSDQAKKDLLTAGLLAKGVAISEINSTKTLLNNIATYIIANVPESVEIS